MYIVYTMSILNIYIYTTIEADVSVCVFRAFALQEGDGTTVEDFY